MPFQVTSNHGPLEQGTEPNGWFGTGVFQYDTTLLKEVLAFQFLSVGISDATPVKKTLGCCAVDVRCRGPFGIAFMLEYGVAWTSVA